MARCASQQPALPHGDGSRAGRAFYSHVRPPRASRPAIGVAQCYPDKAKRADGMAELRRERARSQRQRIRARSAKLSGASVVMMSWSCATWRAQSSLATSSRPAKMLAASRAVCCEGGHRERTSFNFQRWALRNHRPASGGPVWGRRAFPLRVPPPLLIPGASAPNHYITVLTGVENSYFS